MKSRLTATLALTLAILVNLPLESQAEGARTLGGESTPETQSRMTVTQPAPETTKAETSPQVLEVIMPDGSKQKGFIQNGVFIPIATAGAASTVGSAVSSPPRKLAQSVLDVNRIYVGEIAGSPAAAQRFKIYL